MAIERCEEKVQLLQAYQKATEAFSTAVSDLSRNIGIVPIEEYRRLSDFAEICRHQSTDARDRLEQHIADHGC